MEQVIRKTLMRGTEAGSLGGIALYSLAASVCSSCAHPRLVVIAPWFCITSKVKEGQELPVLPFLFFCNRSYPAACRVILPGALLKAIFPVERDWLWLYRLWQRRGLILGLRSQGLLWALRRGAPHPRRTAQPPRATLRSRAG